MLSTTIYDHDADCANVVHYAAAAIATNPEKCWYNTFHISLLGLRFPIASRARGEYLRTHFKNTREVAAALTG